MVHIMGITSLRQFESAAHSASVDDTVLECDLLHQIIGILIQKITCSVLENTLLIYLRFSFLYALAKSESAHSNDPASTFMLY